MKASSTPAPPIGADVDEARVLLSELFHTEADRVFGFVMARCGSRSVAEDVTAETFADAARAVQAGRGAQIGGGWLFDVARKRLVDHWRREQRERRRREQLLHFSLADRHPRDDESDLVLVEALDSLPDRQRAVLALRYLDEYSVGEVAAALELTYRATESLLARARRSLLSAYEARISK